MTQKLVEAKAIACNMDDFMLGDIVYLATCEDDVSFEDMGAEIKNTILACQTEEEYEIANKMLCAITGYRFASIVSLERRRMA